MLDLSSLNREQLEAVLSTEGPVLVLAGAGSGKTRVITYRLAHLIERGVPPAQILCVTFTNKAAFEMRERARKLVGAGVRATTISTFHALGAKILRIYPERVGLKRGFTITDAKDQIGSLRRILRELRLDDRQFDAKRVMAMISAAKNAGWDAARFRAEEGYLPLSASLPELKDASLEEDYAIAGIEAYERYEEQLRAQNVVDFDDLLLLTLRLIEGDEEVRFRLQRKWRYLQIDEYQDTNGAQFELMRAIAGDKRNLCVVGDDDQSIYGWRGADITHILSFGRQFPGAKIVKLETNYRSTGHILSVANTIIEQNEERYDKTLKPAAGEGEPVKIVAMEDEDAEAEQLAEMIHQLTLGPVAPKDIAVLYRSNVQARPIELSLRAEGVPYRVVGGMDLFDRKEIKDALCYLKVLNNPDDEQSLRRVINYPPRGIGAGSILKIDDWARGQGIHLPEALARAAEVPGLGTRAENAIGAFLELIASHRKLLGRRKLSTVVKKLIAATGLEAALFSSSDDGNAAARRVDNVREIVRQVERFEKKKRAQREEVEREGLLPLEPAEAADEDALDALDELAGVSLEGFLGDLALAGWGEDSSKEDKEDMVVLSTIHAAKGLEWPYVFLVGVEEELLPHRRTLEGDGEVEEERRLAYVAVTRARAHLSISYALSRARYGQIIERDPSRFLEDLPEEAVCFEGAMKVERTEAEEAAIVADQKQQIRALLGIGAED